MPLELVQAEEGEPIQDDVIWSLIQSPSSAERELGWVKFWTKFAPFLHDAARRELRGQQDSYDLVEEIASEAKIKFIAYASSPRTKPESLSAYLYRIVRNAALDHHEKVGREREALRNAASEMEVEGTNFVAPHDETDHDDSDKCPISARERFEAMIADATELTPAMRTAAFVLQDSRARRVSVKKVTEEMGLPYPGVRQGISRLKVFLRKRFGSSNPQLEAE